MDEAYAPTGQLASGIVKIPGGDTGRKAEAVLTPITPPNGPGPVKSGVEAEIAEPNGARPGLAHAVLAMARVLDNPACSPLGQLAALIQHAAWLGGWVRVRGAAGSCPRTLVGPVT